MALISQTSAVIGRIGEISAKRSCKANMDHLSMCSMDHLSMCSCFAVPFFIHADPRRNSSCAPFHILFVQLSIVSILRNSSLPVCFAPVKTSAAKHCLLRQYTGSRMPIETRDEEE